MSLYTRSQMINFLQDNVNINNFNTFSKILLLEDTTLMSRVLNYLYDFKISIFDLDVLVPFDESSLTIFLNSFDNKFNPPTFLNNPLSTFNGSSYIQGITSGFTDLYVMYKEYNEEKNLGIPLVRTDFKVNVLVNRPNKASYASLNDFKTDFNNKVLPLVLAEFSVADIREVFPLSNDLVTSSITTNATNIKAKYESIFDIFLPILDNTNLFNLLTNINVEDSFFSNNRSKFFSIYNFNSKLGNIIPSMYCNTIGNVNALERVFNTTERNIFKNLFLDTTLEVDLQNAFAWIKFYYTLTSLINDDLNLSIDTLYKNDLDLLVTKITNFKTLVDLIYSKSNQLLQLSEF